MSETATALIDVLQAWQERPVGEDPRFSDSFARLRAEVEKLAGNDFTQIRDQGLQLLTDQALDMRVLAYTTLAQTYLEGVSGLANALEAWCWLVRTAWIEAGISCHPQRENGRISAVTWLQQERLASYLDNDPGSADDVAALTEQLKAFHALLDEKIADPVRLKPVERWLANHQPQAPAAPAAQPAAPARDAQHEASSDDAAVEPRPATPQAPPAGDNGNAPLAINSSQQEEKTVRDLLAWYRQEQRFEPMVRLSRSLRWSDLVVPPAEDNKTRVPAPRATSLNALQHALSQGDPAQALLAAEKAFLEPGGQYCLQIQKAAAEAARSLGLSTLSELVQRETVALLERHRGLMSLQFADGSPFVEGDTRNWLDSLMTSSTDTASDTAGQWSEVAVQAGQVCNQSGLAEGLRVLDEVATRGRRERTEQDLLKAELCLSSLRSDLAVPLLEAVAERLDDHGIAAWEPAFAVRVWRLLQQALRARGEDADTRHRLDQIGHYISRTDIRTAAAIL